jgi:tetratricopeptide (TPR) repeat protein
MAAGTQPIDLRSKRAERLVAEGYACVAARDWDGALGVADRLEALKHSGAFEIGALAHAGKGDVEEAVRVLETGVARAPTVWSNWQLLGNCRSDLGRFSDAAAAYQRALDCPDVWWASVRLNQAILAARRGDHTTALALASDVSDAGLALPATRIRVVALAALGRGTEAERIGLATLGASGPASEDPERAEIAAVIARLRLERGDAKPAVRAFAVGHWALDVANDRMLAVIRDVDDTYAPDAAYHRLKVEGRVTSRCRSRPDAKGYLCSFHVVAADPEEALAFVRRLDTREPDCALSVVEAEVVEPRPDEPKGVYWASPLFYYEED